MSSQGSEDRAPARRRSRFIVALVALGVPTVLVARVLGLTPAGILLGIAGVLALAWLLSTETVARFHPLWSVRSRLLFTYFLVGVVPIGLILTILSIAAYMLLGQTTAYLLSEYMDRRSNVLAYTAYDIARRVSLARGPIEPALVDQSVAIVRARVPRVHAIVRTGTETLSVADEGPRIMFPEWIQPGFAGMLAGEEVYLLAASSRVTGNGRDVDVLVYQVLDEETLADLMRELGTLRVPAVATRVDSAGAVRLAEPEGWWDVTIGWGLPLEVRALESGMPVPMGGIIRSRPSIVVGRLFSTLGQFSGALGVALLSVSGVLLVVELLSLLLIWRLTRSMTRTVRDLSYATGQVEAGNFAHRIPVRRPGQLSALAEAFNKMTAQVEQLLVSAREKERLEMELQIAREVHDRLLPGDDPGFVHLDVARTCRAAWEVGGDYHDAIPLGASTTALLVGDVSGKGISAALLMAGLRSAVRSLLTAHPQEKSDGDPDVPSTAWVMGALNRQLYESSSSDKFATVFCSVFDARNGTLRYTNAGQVAPLLIRDGVPTRLESNGLLVGAFSGVTYTEETVSMRPGDLLVAFTDGVTECENAEGEEFGHERLIEVLRRHGDQTPGDLVETVLAAVEAWAVDLGSQDDTTILVARSRSEADTASMESSSTTENLTTRLPVG